MELTVKRIDAARAADIRLPNEPFPLYGRMKPAYRGGVWSYTTELFPPQDVSEMCFPDEAYDYAALAAENDFVGVYDENGVCAGLAVYRASWNRYLYLYDLKVNAALRGKGAGRLLIEAGKALAREKGYAGLYTQGQDNNLGACLFYIAAGFEIGGLDTRVYAGTKQAGKSDIVFYLDL